MGNAGPVMIFVCALAGTTIISFFVLAYTAFCFLTVVQDTAAGVDEVVWPDEPWKDWFRGAAYVGGLVLIWLAPAGILSRALRHAWLADDPALRFLLIAGPGLWLFFPVGLLSALSSVSRWVPFRITIVRQFLRIVPSLLVFYACTALVGLAVVTPWFYALFRSGSYWLPVAAAAWGAGVLIYARLLGRLGWLVSRLKPLPVKAGGAPVPPAKRRRDTKTIRKAVRAHDPWAAPKGEPTDPHAPDLPVEGYGMVEEEPRRRKKQKKVKPEAEPPAQPLPVEGYDMAGPAAERPSEPPLDGYLPVGLEPLPAEDRTMAQDAIRFSVTSEIDKQLAQGPKPPYVPPAPLFSGVYTFPWYSSSLKEWVFLSLGGMAVGFCVRFLMGGI